jgi:protease-4
MSTSHDPNSGPLEVIPVHQPRRREPSALRWLVRFFVFLILMGSLTLNALLVLLWIPYVAESGTQVQEHLRSGSKLASNTIAIIHIDGVLMEGMTTFAEREIERAAADAAVKAVVLRINSPGGTITASDDLHKRIAELRDGDPKKNTSAKPVVVSMGSVAASGGYYIAMPAKTVLAEPATITASIGVYAALPNITELGKKIGFTMELIKAGEVKDSGSPLKEMTPKERQIWQDMVDHSYLRFLQVVEQGRPALKGKLQDDILIDEVVHIRDTTGPTKHVKYTRYRADGGIFTADAALKYGLVDQIGYLDDAVRVAQQAAGLGEDYKVISYERPPSLFGSFLGVDAKAADSVFDLRHISEGAVPRLWYMAPQSELAGILAAAGRR